ncbi:DUF1542 domain-containing protein [Hoyosella sp. YIM 151337]|uniref:DUF1542 domain-containing protein n=1 Tax=Hoyosella sp. YIM 151337 TaxID=2992742 RepID=UPI0022363330|nr:DUF1542 domain-containing protein [Hoyosella sp. YIM 151337]MCW4353498.1 DUF1542 domain-containing protein [Hoyosella sp. YIM 151337]
MELLLIALVILIIVFVVRANSARSGTAGVPIEDAQAEARRWIDRLGGQVLNLTGSDDASKQALADASERYTAAGGQIESAQTPRQAQLAQETAMEGLYYVRAAREAMGMDPGPPLPGLDGQSRAGQVSEERTVQVEGRDVSASPRPSDRTPNYYPGGTVAGRPVPAGWYSEPWWKPALVAGAWGIGSVFLFSALFAGMSGVNYDAAAFESGAGADAGGGGDAGAGDYGDQGDYGDFGGGDADGGGFDMGGFDF